MKTSAMKDTKFLRKEDCGAGILLTITGVEQANVAMSDQPEELRWTLTFAEARALILNAINTQILEKLFGDETDDWEGQKVVAYTDPMVTYQGKLVGGVRLRAPKVKAAPKPVPVNIEADDADDPGVPF